MKKTLAICTAAAAFAAISFAEESVSSDNIVGYNTINLVEGEYNLVSTAFLSTNSTIEGLFADLPSGSAVLLWDKIKQSYISVNKTRGGWDAGATNVIARGSGVFVQVPSGQGNQEVVISGDVPNDGTYTNYTSEGYTLVSYPYTTDTVFSNTAVYANSTSGDSVSFWNPDTGYTTFNKTRGGWDAGVETQVVTMGTAYFFNAPSSGTEVEVQPYNLNN
jgi:hypothetical protein